MPCVPMVVIKSSRSSGEWTSFGTRSFTSLYVRWPLSLPASMSFVMSSRAKWEFLFSAVLHWKKGCFVDLQRPLGLEVPESKLNDASTGCLHVPKLDTF